MDFKVTTALKKIYDCKKRKVICSSGTSCGKTVAIIAILIDYAARIPKSKILVVAETIPAVKSGCINIFKDIMISTNRYHDERYNATERIYTFGNGSTIQFSSFDTVGKAKVAGKRNVLFINEANHINFNIANELIVRTTDKIFFDFNPSEECWIHTEIMNDEDSELISLYYTDNEALDENTIKELNSRLEKAKTSEYWKNWCDIYIYGKIGSVQGAVFQDMKIIDFIPDGCDFIGYGMDFGFTNDPTTLVEIWKWNNNYILNQLLYQTEMTNSDIIKFIKENNIKGLIVADSAEPKSIEEIKRAGINITGAIKGKDSISSGLDLMRRETIFVTSTSLDLIKEMRNYCWMTDNNGNILNTPIDDYNHCFVGDTLITTINGYKKIKDIEINDLVLTSNGYKPVLKKFNNGKKTITNYVLTLDTQEVYLSVTNNHKIKTENGWKEISKIEKGDILYLHKYLTEKNINYIKGKDIIQEDVKDFTELFGNQLMVKFQKDFIYTIKTEIQQIIELKTLNSSNQKNILKNTVKKIMKSEVLNGMINFKKVELKKLKNGINQKKVLNGINSTLKKIILDIKHMVLKIVKYVIQNLNQKILIKNSVQINVSQNIEELINSILKQENVLFVKNNLKQINIIKQKLVEKNVVGTSEEIVYDLMIDETHEYFANNILVHNCIDASRYCILFHNIKGMNSRTRTFNI